MPGLRPDRMGPVSSVTPWRTSTTVVAVGGFDAASAAASVAGAGDSEEDIARDRNGRSGSAGEAEELGGDGAGRAQQAAAGNRAAGARHVVNGVERHDLPAGVVADPAE